MGKFIDISGQRFGCLTVEKTAGLNSSGGYKWKCQCDCGGTTVTNGSDLRKGRTTKCLQCCQIRHGHTGSRRGRSKTSATYRSWYSMRKRCRDSRDPRFKAYGGKGISVCDRWYDSFEAFLADMGEKPEGYHLDRINPDGNYEPSNCRWLSARENLRHNPSIETLVRDFYWKYKCRHMEKPGFLADEQVALRKEILVEEFAELLEAIEERNLRHIAKEICDLVYVAVGFAIACGLPFNDAFLAVHRSNLSKDGSRRADGKITKGAAYVPPDLSFIEEE